MSRRRRGRRRATLPPRDTSSSPAGTLVISGFSRGTDAGHEAMQRFQRRTAWVTVLLSGTLLVLGIGYVVH